MNDDDHSLEEREQRRIDFEAADWTVRHDRSLTAREQDEFMQWLARDPRHGEAFKRQQETWNELDVLAQWRPEHSVEPNPALLRERPHHRPWRWTMLAAAAVVTFATVVWYSAERDSEPVVADVATIPIAQTYERRVLDDGSVVQLNRGAAIAAHYTKRERHVALTQGEAYFTVAKNPARPFVVQASDVAVQAVGTAFNVRLANDGVEVLVTEGRVKVYNVAAAENAGIYVGAGERAVMPMKGASPSAVTKVSSDQVARALAWQPQLLDFSSTPLVDVIAEFNRHNRTQLVIEDSALERLPIVATFRSDNVDGFVRLLEATAGVHAERSATKIVLSRAR
jgi:transmembrane sensor